jgi:undecaprenyl-diphosphatase
MVASVDASLLAPSRPAISVSRPDAAAHPHRRSVAIVVIGYLALTLVLLGVGWLLTHPLDASIGRWDERVNEHFASARTPFWNDVTQVATASFNTVPVVVASFLVVSFLALRKHVREAVFLTLALVIEITVFLSVTFVVARPRPDVVRLNSTPATSSFPSGHTAAATVLFFGVAIIVVCCVPHVVARVAAFTVAVLVTTTVGFARVYRGLHHPTDVFVGALFGLACLLVAGLAVRAHAERRRARSEGPPEGEHRRADEALQG